MSINQSMGDNPYNGISFGKKNNVSMVEYQASKFKA
jgi:hypothetical protein